MARAGTTIVGVGLSAAIIAAWVITHIIAVFSIEITSSTWMFVPLVILFQSWLSVGLFIVAHDAIHGTIAPSNSALNRAIGRIAINLYGGFNYDKLASAHHLHHKFSGTETDPDFCPDHPNHPVLWAWAFFKRHATWRMIIFFNVVFNVELHLLGASVPNLILFYCIPAILSAAQLFYFGTYLPHRHVEGEQFEDDHRARSSNFGSLLSLLTCYHFGYHHEHHEHPYVPWWRLPAMRRERVVAAQEPA